MTKRKDGLYQEVLSISGKKKYFYGRTKTEVLKKVREYKEGEERGVMLSDMAKEWQAAHAGEVGYKTAESHIAPVKDIVNHFSGISVKEVTPPMVKSFMRDIEKRGIAKRTVQLRLDVLRMIFDYAITAHNCIDSNPCQAVSVSKNLPVSTRDIPSRKDIELIKEHAHDSRFAFLPFFLCYTGLRLGEALALTDNDFRDGVIHISKKVSWQPNQPVVESWTKTKKGMREVPILDILQNEMPKWNGYLFSDDGDKPYTKSAFVKRWRKYAAETGVQTTCHCLRHEFATLMYDAEVDVKEAAEILGHDEKVMRDIYTHITENRRQKTARKLNDYVNNMYNTQ